MTVAAVETPITLNERCDSSQSEAAVVWVQLTPDPASVLSFCGHHYARHEKALLARTPYRVIDLRETSN